MSAIDRCFAFAGGRLGQTNPPEWFVKMVSEADDSNTAIRRAGFDPIEDFGEGGDNIIICRSDNGQYLITYGDHNETIAYIFVANVADYLSCRASLIAPLASLIMESDRHFEWQEARKRKRAS